MWRIAIGDIHGTTHWKNHLVEDFSELYLLGDYFDSFDIPFSQQYRNFLEICKTARQDSRIKLCVGNHDYHYMMGVSGQRYSGFQEKNFYRIANVLEENIDLLKVLYVTPDKYIISHAGLSSTFMENMKNRGVITIEGINGAFVKDRDILSFNGFEVHGDDITQSPIWIRPGSLCEDHIPGYNQIVGHTPGDKIREIPLPGQGNTAAIKIAFIDTEPVDSAYKF